MTHSANGVTARQDTIALALSGGGARAIAFHLGCLRALHNAGILERVIVISSVSGGSVLAALYCHHTGDFSAFEKKVHEVLARGFVWPALRVAVTSLEGIKAVVCVLPLAVDRFAAFFARLALRLVAPTLAARISWLWEPTLRRWASRTTILRRVLGDVFGGDTLLKLRTDRPKLIIVACELRQKSAFYFARDGVGSWRLGETDPKNVEIAQAVTASAAYPALLPALDENMTFVKDGVASTRRVILTDGGIYDNLGLAPLWPDRDPLVSLHVGKYDRIIACRAGYGLKQAPPSIFWPSRMIAVVESIHARAQNFAMNRLFDLKKAGAISGFLLPYLDQADDRLAHPPPDLVTAQSVASYPTDFSAMSKEWIHRLSRRGEQLTLALILEHWPDVAATLS